MFEERKTSARNLAGKVEEKWKKMSTGLVAAAAATKVAYGNGWDGCGHVWSELLYLVNKIYIW